MHRGSNSGVVLRGLESRPDTLPSCQRLRHAYRMYAVRLWYGVESVDSVVVHEPESGLAQAPNAQPPDPYHPPISPIHTHSLTHTLTLYLGSVMQLLMQPQPSQRPSRSGLDG